MAEVSVERVERHKDGLHIFGSGFTMTSTTVYVDGMPASMDYVSANEIIVDARKGASIEVEKNAQRSQPILVDDQNSSGGGGKGEDKDPAEELHKTAQQKGKPREEGRADILNRDLDQGDQSKGGIHISDTGKDQENQGPVGPGRATGVIRGGGDEGGPLFHVTREQEKPGRVDPISDPVYPNVAEVLDIPPGQPYPTGNPQDPEEAFRQAHGYKRDPAGNQPEEVTGEIDKNRARDEGGNNRQNIGNPSGQTGLDRNQGPNPGQGAGPEGAPSGQASPDRR